MKPQYRGSLKLIDWTDLPSVHQVAAALNGVVGKVEERPNYNIYPTRDQALNDGAKIIDATTQESL